MTKIAAVSNVHLLEKAQDAIQQLSSSPVIFHDEDKQPSTEMLIERTDDAEAILVSPGTKITSEYLDACPSVKYIGLCGTSKTNIDEAELEKRGIKLSNVVDYGDEPAAEFVFFQLIELFRGVGKISWKNEPHELFDKSIGIIGLGALGISVADLARGFKMQVSYSSRTRKPEQEAKGIVYKDKTELLKSCDVIVICSPTDVEVLSSADFENLAEGAVLVQASMGSCFDHDAFLAWIDNENNSAIFDYSAGSNAYEAYADLPRVVFPKIIAGHTHETKQRLGDRVVENLKTNVEGTE